jgi:DNA polymerase-3 subunit beta
MDFSMDAGELARILTVVKGCVPARSTMPVLQCVLVEASAGRVSVRGTCIDMEALASGGADVKVDGTAAIHADMLHGLAKRLPKAAVVTVTVEDDVATLTSAKANYKIRTLPADTFPVAKAPEGGTLSIPAADLKALLNVTISATNANSQVQYHRGVYVHVIDGETLRLAVVGTDGHRLAYRDVPAPEAWRNLAGVTIPTASAQQILSLIEDAEGDVEITLSETRVMVRCNGSEISTAVLDCQYPDYTRFVPEPNGALVTVNTAQLIDAVERAIIVLTGDELKVPAVGLAPGLAGLGIVAGKRGHEVAGETLDAEVHERGAEVDVSANYLTQMLKLWPDGMPVEIQQEGPGSPILFWSKGDPTMRQVIMPMRR